MRLRKINFFLRLSVISSLALLLSCLTPTRVQSQALNLNGLVELDYNSSTTTSKTFGEKTESKTSDFLQRYVLSGAGIIVDPRLASYSASIGITDSVYKNTPAAGGSTEVGRDTLTYGLQMNLLPTRSPINLFAQRNVISVENAPNLISDTYSIGWATTVRALTALRVTLLQIGTEYEDPTNPRDTRIRIANLGLTQSFSSGSLSANYQYTDYLVTTKNEETSSKINSYSLRGEDKLTPSLFLSGNVTYFPKGSFFAPGITSTSETTGEIGLLHQLERFNQNIDYTFRKTQSGDIERDTLSYTMNYRPRAKTDYRAEALYSQTASQQTDTNEYRIAGGVTHRPFHGLSITANMVLDHFGLSGITENRVDRVGTSGGINYFKLFDSFNLNANYLLDHSLILSNQAEAEGSIITHSAALALQTRTLQIMQVLGSYTLLLRKNNIVPTDDRQDQTVRIETVSTYFRRWLLRAATSLSNVLNYGNTFIFDTRAEYFPIAGTNFAGGYRLSDFPSATNSQDSQLYFIEGSHDQYLTRQLSLNLKAHGEREELRYTEKTRLTFTSLLNYQLGYININFEFREDYTKYPESVYNVQSYFVRASRPF